MVPDDVLVFPINTPNDKIVDLKQLLSAQKSLGMLQEEIKSGGGFGAGYLRLLQGRATECQAIINKIKEKYKDS